MIGAILAGIGGLIGGAGAIAAPMISGIGSLIGGAGTIAAPVISGVGTLGGQIISGAGSIFQGLPAVSKAVMPMANFWAQIDANRAAQRIAGKQYSLGQQQIQAQRDIAFQNALLTAQPVQVQATPAAQPRQIVIPAPAEPAGKMDDTFLVIIIAAILGLILILRKLKMN